MVLEGFDIGRLPAEPDIEIDGVAVRLEVEFLDVVDIGADHHLGGAGGRGRGRDGLGHGLGRGTGGRRLAPRREGSEDRQRQSEENAGGQAANNRLHRQTSNRTVNKWCRKRDSNPRPHHYEALHRGVLAIHACGLNFTSVHASRRLSRCWRRLQI